MTPVTADSIVVEVANQQDREVDGQTLVSLIRSILEPHGFRTGEVSLAMVTDPAMRELNRQYLGHDYETDVLSFLLDSDPDAGSIEAQLIVSVDTAVREATRLATPWEEELMLYVAHGTLHLVGLDDGTPEGRADMRAAEREVLGRFGIEPRWEGDGEP